MKIADSVFLVTGGSSGLGAAVVRMALDAGARVVIADLAEPIEADLLPEWKDRWTYVHTDVAQEASAMAAVQVAIGHFKRLDVLVNSAGIARAEKINGKEGPHRLSVFAKTIEVNLIGSFNMMRLAVPAFVASGALPESSKGVIINTASIAAFDGQIGQTPRAASWP
jgi:NAD(P)-dependent dehydrogenase (short-subunit alcohol dehydrogenase family)